MIPVEELEAVCVLMRESANKIVEMRAEIARMSATIKRQHDELESLKRALAEIADRGPVEFYSSVDALKLRLVITQTIARTALGEGEP